MSATIQALYFVEYVSNLVTERAARELQERPNQTNEDLPPPATWDPAYQIDRSYEARRIASNFEYFVPVSLLYDEVCVICMDLCYDGKLWRIVFTRPLNKH